MAKVRQLNSILCGSYKRDLAGLRNAYIDLERISRILSPTSVDFIDETADFVRLNGQQTISIKNIEDQHLRAIAEANFIWLHAPKGYVGMSASFEIGYATSLQIPIFSNVAPTDILLSQYVIVINHIMQIAGYLN